ncbi:kinesin-like protein KIN-14J isoform X1 [Quercus lobata]|uniref:kinesin-like protein KIN-14J isoform X1 n=2 Tax=Quercus lobata TaxID=97700 RepID=UPI001247D112|nr:kinesin-like protein KIN-14J isoform X1 [Quercus lobata]
MNSQYENGGFGYSNGAHGEYVEQLESFRVMAEGNQQSSLVEWINGMLPHLSLPLEASEEDLRSCLIDGTVLCSVLNKLSPGLIEMRGNLEPVLLNVQKFLAAINEIGLPGFELSDLEQGSMVPVLQCLNNLRVHFNSNAGVENVQNHLRRRWDLSEVGSLEGIGSQGDVSHGQHLVKNGGDWQRDSVEAKFQHSFPGTSELSDALQHHLGSKFHEVLQLKQGCFADSSDAKILEMIKSNSLDNASTQSLFNIVNKILDDSMQRKNGDVPNCVAWLLRKVTQVIEQRISTQAENLKIQNKLFKAREEKYQSKIRVLETLSIGAAEEFEVVMDQFQQIKIEKVKTENKKKLEEHDMIELRKQKDHCDIEIMKLKQELEVTKRMHEDHCLQLETTAKEAKVELENRLKEFECLLSDSRKKVEELEKFSESKLRRLKKKERIYKSFIDNHFGALQESRATLESIKHEVLKTKRGYAEEFRCLGLNLEGLADAAQNYHAVLAENRRLYNEVQDLKGNIRVYCRIRPFLPGQSKKHTTIEYIGENGELVIMNPSKGKDSRRMFKFNKVFHPTSTQEEVFMDTQPLIRSVLDGYNVCIFAYGQTGSGKTYTMSGPSVSSKEDWGVNYRALNDLFQISQSRKSSIAYEIGVQMVEIYNEQVRDLLSSDGPQKRLGIWSTTQPNGLAVPEASMHSVQSTSDVLEFMHIGLMNRAVGATALNERSSRSHSVLTVHVRGTDLETNAVLRGSLHLVDLAGSERVDRSEATGDRLREAQHINKSLSALGDVIFALAQKSSHVPYRNSKLTQVLQSSLGGQAKTLMFVQLNPDTDSYSETISTLKFAERVSGVELGAARSNKEGRDVRELMEQVASLKDVVAKKDEEIDRLQLSKANVNGVKHGMISLRYGSVSPRRASIGDTQHSQRLSEGKGTGRIEKAASDIDNGSEYSDKHSEAGSQQSLDEFRHQKELSTQSRLFGGDVDQQFSEDIELLGFGNADSDERLSDISDGGLSMGTETDGSISSVVEYTLFPEVAKSAESTPPESIPAEKTPVQKTEKSPLLEPRPTLPSKLPKPPQKLGQAKSSRLSLTTKSTLKVSSSARKAFAGSSSVSKTPKRWQ